MVSIPKWGKSAFVFPELVKGRILNIFIARKKSDPSNN